MAIDREKVISGLEHCIRESESMNDNPCKGCPYVGASCAAVLKTEALHLLKEQNDIYSLIREIASRDDVEKTYIEPGQEYEAPIIEGPATVLVIQG